MLTATQMRGMSYTQLAYEVISKFVGPDDIPSEKLRDIVNRSFATFRTPGTFNHTKCFAPR
jgi:threonine synthase